MLAWLLASFPCYLSVVFTGPANFYSSHATRSAHQYTLSCLLGALRSSGDFSSIHSIVRRPDSTPSAVAGTTTNAPVTVKEHVVDFEKLLSDDASTAAEEAGKLRAVSADCVFISLGTTRAAAGSAEKFERIDREYVIAAAKAARREEQGQQGGFEEGKTPGQTLLYVSSSGASSKLPLLYPK